MTLGFFLDEIASIPSVRSSIAPAQVTALEALEDLKLKAAKIPRVGTTGASVLSTSARIDPAVPGFHELAIAYGQRAGISPSEIGAFIHVTPPSRRSDPVIHVMLTDGHDSETSYEEIELLLSQPVENAIYRWQVTLFVIGLVIQFATIAYTQLFFPKPKPAAP